jgi:hypothetical protein
MSLLTTASGLLSVGGVVPNPVSIVTGLVGSILPSVGSKYTKATFVTRFMEAAQSGSNTAGQLADQAVYHSFIQTGISDADVWRGLLSTIYEQGPQKWRSYIESVLAGAPLQYDYIGQRVPNPVQLPSGTVTTAAAPKTIGEQLLDFLGVGSKTQEQLATTAGQQAGQQIGAQLSKVLLGVGLVVVVLFVIVKLLKR